VTSFLDERDLDAVDDSLDKKEEDVPGIGGSSDGSSMTMKEMVVVQLGYQLRPSPLTIWWDNGLLLEDYRFLISCYGTIIPAKRK
jgi:hypothetical protein